MRIVWVSPWEKTHRISAYSRVIWPEIQQALQRKMGDTPSEGIVVSLDRFPTLEQLFTRLQELQPDLIHFQHDYELYGGKFPPGYFFHRLMARLRARLPQTSLVVTAHGVPFSGKFLSGPSKGFEGSLLAVGNFLLFGYLSQVLGKKTWGLLDGVHLHSKLQVHSFEKVGVHRIEVIPHFAPGLDKTGLPQGSGSKTENLKDLHSLHPPRKQVLVYGFFSEEKGQDIVVEALPHLDPTIRIIMAGGARRTADHAYMDKLLGRARQLGVRDRIAVTGFLEERFFNQLCASATMVVAPFRKGEGSLGLFHLLARGVPILTSDLPSHREIADRVPGCLEFFRSDDPIDCAEKISLLVGASDRLNSLSTKAAQYALTHQPKTIAERLIDFYQSVKSVRVSVAETSAVSQDSEATSLRQVV